jgi:predicted RNA-binding Zn-ribbon protein involved in translation (DUF1610 family)
MNQQRWHYKQISQGHYLAVGLCSICGVEYSNNNIAASLYCPACAEKINREKTAERVKKHRLLHKNDANIDQK